MLTPVDHFQEEGFTMVELVVGLALSAIVIALLFGAITDMFSSSERSANRSKAQRAAVNAAEMLTNDLRSMRAPQREPRFTGSGDALRNLLLFQSPTTLDVHDLTTATQERVTFFAETVNTSANAECITWEVLSNGSMHRTVRAFTRGCATPGAVLQQSEVMPPPERARASAAVVIPAPFSYRTLEQPVPVPANPDPDRCTAHTRTTRSTNLQRDQVLGIDMDLRSFVASNSARGDQELLVSAAIASRQSQEYRFAIGCAA